MVIFCPQPNPPRCNDLRTILRYSYYSLLSLASHLPPKNRKGATYPKWQPITLSFDGPETSESADDNPFLNYRLIATFTHGTTSYEVPGFYAADGQAAESGAEAGKVWQVRFSPDAEGEWTYQLSFRKGDSLAVSDDPQAGEPLAFDGTEGTFQVTASDCIGSRLLG